METSIIYIFQNIFICLVFLKRSGAAGNPSHTALRKLLVDEIKCSGATIL